MRHLALALVLVASAGCRQSAYSAAAKADTIEGYQRFLAEHPDDLNADAARERLAELSLAEARQAHTVIAYKRFLEAFPASDEAKAARALLEGLRYSAARSAGTAAAWRQLVIDHPEGPHRVEAEAELERLERAELSQATDPEQLARAAKLGLSTEAGAKASAKLDDLAYQAATGPADWLRYLSEFPAGAHRDEARVRLLDVELEGLLVSGLLDEAQALVTKSPLGGQVPKAHERLSAARTLAALPQSEPVRRALPQWTLRPADELARSLSAPDALDRWQAAQELGDVVSVATLEPLLGAIRAARNPLVRVEAFRALSRVAKALPPAVVELWLTRRLEAVRRTASDEPLLVELAAIDEVLGRSAQAVTGYRRALQPGQVDLFALWRTIELRRGQGGFESAIAARQELQSAVALASESDGLESRARARVVCAARAHARHAQEVIASAPAPDAAAKADRERFGREATAALATVDAQLRDAELKLLEADPRVPTCGDARVSERLAAGAQARLQALQSLEKQSPAQATLVRQLAWAREPDPAVRAWLGSRRSP